MENLVANEQSLNNALKHLSKDNVLKILIDKYPKFNVSPNNDTYESLISSIISQQLSVKAADTIQKRLMALFNNKLPNPEQIIDADQEELRSVGISYSKVGYMKDLASKIRGGEIDLNNFINLSNQEIIDELVSVKGIGTWTAHMFLIFCLTRLDVLATGDLGIRKGIMNQYGLKQMPTEEEVKKIAKVNNWSPYESIACWYIWRSLENKD